MPHLTQQNSLGKAAPVGACGVTILFQNFCVIENSYYASLIFGII
jgi:hypothetical protein